MPAKTTSTTKFPTIVGPDGSAPTFACGNHQPPHTAKSIKKLLELAQTKGCRKFHVALPEPVGSMPTWVCGNHEQPHIANSTGEIQTLKAEEGCRSFRALGTFLFIPQGRPR